MCARGEESKARERSTRARPPISSRLSCISRACTASSQPSSLRPPARPRARAPSRVRRWLRSEWCMKGVAHGTARPEQGRAAFIKKSDQVCNKGENSFSSSSRFFSHLGGGVAGAGEAEGGGGARREMHEPRERTDGRPRTPPPPTRTSRPSGTAATLSHTPSCLCVPVWGEKKGG